MSTKLDDAFATLRILIADTSRDLAMAMAELRSVAAERDALHAERDNLWQQRDAMQGVMKTLAAERDNARQSLRAAEQDLADLEADNSTLRTVNLRILADCRAAMQRADTAEAILRAKA